VEPPSRQLLELLSRYALATPADIRRCRGQVRRLAHDLPTFDSVWIDALTQSRVLTPFQARLLESESPHRLQVGPCILVDEWEKDGRWTLRVAKHRSTRKRCLLTFIDVPAHDLPKALTQVRDVIARLRGLSYASILVPQGGDVADERLVVVSPFLTGPTLKQLLVRRGRFPVPIVADIAWQLIDGLASLEEREVVHGDVTLIGIRLTNRGQAVLLHPGVMPAAGSRVSIHAPLDPENYDGTAPELISSGRTATPQSDLYALGCLLWQLLAGRPPYPTGDPLAKLAAHQTKRIDDIRRWVPDAPAELAAVLTLLTDKNPQRRGTPRELRERWPLAQARGQRRLARFHSSFGTVAPRPGDVHRSASRFPLTAAGVALFVLVGVSLSLLDAGARNELLRLADRATGRRSERSGEFQAPGENLQHDAARHFELIPFPTQPLNGVIELLSDGPYDAANVTVDGPLVIRAAGGARPHVVIRGRPLRITAAQVLIQCVHFTAASDAGPVLIAVQCRKLFVEGCRFDAAQRDTPPGGLAASDHATATAIAWKVVDPANPTGGELLMRNSHIDGALHGVETHAMPRGMLFDNCLKTGAGSLIRFAHEEHSTPLTIHLHQTTLRDSGGIVHWSERSSREAIQPLSLVAQQCVFDVPSDKGALLRFAGTRPPQGWEGLVHVTGEGSLIRAGTVVAASHPHQPGALVSIDAFQLRLDGLLADDFEFAGPGLHDPQASAIAFTQAPRSSPIPPGIDAHKLTAAAATPLVRQTARP
jgi:hypothetical protein